jgi:hypothetical protein
MDAERTTYIGIDPGDFRQPYTFAVLDGEQMLIALSQGHLRDVMAYVSGRLSATIAISGPLRYNLGLIIQEAVRNGLEPVPRIGESTDLRVAEYLLAARGAPVTRTPAVARYCPRSIQRAVELSQCLWEIDYVSFPAGEAPRQVLEAQAEVCYWSLLGLEPFPVHSLEGRLQRQLTLYEEKLPIPDPMDFFEEVTRFKLLKGVLPVKDIYAPTELNALAAAYTAWLAVRKPERVERVGLADEGEIWLPIRRENELRK